MGVGSSVKRMAPEDRRKQILEVACRLFAQKPFNDVWIDDLTVESGISRGLLYHYFGSKQGLLRAVFRRESEIFNAATLPDAQLAPPDRLNDGLDRYLRYVRNHPDSYRAIHQGVMSSDPEIQAIREHNVALQVARVVSAIEVAHTTLSRQQRTEVEFAMTGWIALVVATCLAWIESGMPPRKTASLKRIWVSAAAGCLEGVLGASVRHLVIAG